MEQNRKRLGRSRTLAAEVFRSMQGESSDVEPRRDGKEGK